MSRNLLRQLAAVLIALIVPIQGMAAVAAGQCMAVGHHQDGGGMDHDHAHDGADDHAASHDSHDEGQSSHCGPCAACCAGSASIAAAAIPPIVAAPASTKHSFFQLPSRGIPLDGIDRPPLSL